MKPIRRAILSVYDKRGVDELAATLAGRGVQLFSSGGTAARLTAAGIPVTPVHELTGFPEILGGRVKTLHPRVAGGSWAGWTTTSTWPRCASTGSRPSTWSW